MIIGTENCIGNFIISRPNGIEVNVRHTTLKIGGCLQKINYLAPGMVKATLFVPSNANYFGKETGTLYTGFDGKEAMTILMTTLQELEKEATK